MPSPVDANDVKGDLKVLKSSVSGVISEDSVSGREVEKADKVDIIASEVNKNDDFPPIGEDL